MANLKLTGCHFIVPVDVYYKDVLFMFGYSREKIIRLLKAKAEDNNTREILKHFKSFKGGYKGLCVVGSVGQTMVLMPTIPSTPEQHGTLIHELFHVVEAIMSNIGNHHAEDVSEESWAHLIGYLTAQVYENLNRINP